MDFIYPWENQFESTFEVPSNCSVTDLPDGYSLDDEIAEISLNYTLDKNILVVNGNYKFKKSTYMVSEYSRVKDYLDQIVKQFYQQIVLEKID